MSWLGEWLRHLVMIVLMAAFVDLILPSRTMERYVRLVLSLLILLALISPIAQLLRSSPAAELRRAFQAQERAESGQQPSLERILAQGQQLQKKQEQNAREYAAGEVARQMKGQIEQETGERVQSVEVAFAEDKQEADEMGTSTIIASVQVKLAASSAAEDPGKPGNGGEDGVSIEPVMVPAVPETDIKVSIEPDGEAAAGEEAVPETEQAGTDGKEAEIVELLHKEWGIGKERIHVRTPPEAV
ncbi:stage III sporulation protein AF [Paenibacillus sp. P96]|uniref:Stage III sporulation protein AF n=1 Tax=Paenibacillus zeirhizosphaerae TaxID=2987519 RepID=A0ABT9FPT5_9BACL|nr:stage III sporulation protein AF [Paenibacillus sp. P96]MDP4096745.1 stage III sporulation protein AF [Paenibacillus sp. P96]